MNQKKNLDQSYNSPSTGQPCNAAQYIAEIMCMRLAEKDQVSGLEYKFWNKARKSDYQSQISAAYKLIERFGEKKLLSFLNSSGKNIYSLGRFNPPKFLIEALTKYRYVEQTLNKTETIKQVEECTTRPSRNRSSLFSMITKAESKNE